MPRNKLTKEQRELLEMYGSISRWEKNAVFLIIQSLAWGNLGPSTDRMTWAQLSRSLPLPKSKGAK